MSATPTFYKYCDLPRDLKLQIVQDAAEGLMEIRQSSRIMRRQFSLGQYACIDLVWQHVIERQTFERLYINSSTIDTFGELCSKRHGILRQVCLDLHPAERYLGPRLSQSEPDLEARAAVTQSIEKLFGVMKDWDPAERRQPGLIKLRISIYRRQGMEGPPIHCEFANLPQVRVIGGVRVEYGPYLHLSSTVALYRKLPNLHHICLDLPTKPMVRSSIQHATDLIISLRDLPHPKKLRVSGHGFENGDWLGIETQLPIIQFLTSPDLRWSETITKLDLPCINNVPRFFHDAQNTLWPHLKTLKLTGALPNMPKIITVTIIMKPSVERSHFSFDVYLRTSSVPKRLSIWSRLPFVPCVNTGFAIISEVAVPGQLVTELQDTIRWDRETNTCDRYLMASTPGTVEHQLTPVDDSMESEAAGSWRTLGRT
ncbi:hypothetical protein J7T55_001459 [Diaporthe amygdali]|uniref:uncharacterized protein n=1 Tax=Phomopsis amygdali TaxID=1214568 RepID=UPI0022FEA25D|nr:uncharacterized protein J7T55_001459 [Diaporthe amygdali]KAJ0115051.1 hypothetical protein J7T55_001459 [Diaporthe amygdali]